MPDPYRLDRFVRRARGIGRWSIVVPLVLLAALFLVLDVLR